MSLRELSEKLGQQTDLMQEIGSDIYDYLGSVISSNDIASLHLDELSSTNQKILNAIEKQSQSTGDDLEEKRDQQVFNKTMVDLLREISSNTKGESGGSDGSGPKQGKFAGALAGGLGIAAKGMGLAAGLGALGFGIGAFFSGLSLGDVAGSYLNADMSTIKKQMITLGEAFSETPTDGLVKMGALLAAGGALGALFGPSKAAKGAVGMTAIGLGIGGFFAGLAASDGLMTMMNADGSMMKSQMINLAEGLAAFSGGQLVGLGALLAVGGVFGAIPGGMKALGKAAVGMGLLGLGIGGFFAGLAVGDKAMDWMNVDGSNLRNMMINLGEGLTGLTKPDYTDLLGFPVAATAAALGIGILTGADVVGSIAGAFSKVGKFLSGDESSIYDRITEGLKQLESIDTDKLKKFDPASIAIGNMASALNSMGNVDMGDVQKSVEGLADTLAFTIPMLHKATIGGTFEYGGGILSDPTKLDFDKGLENIPQSTFDKINSVVSVNSASQQSSPTSSENVSTVIRENNETKNNSPVIVMDNSTSNNVSGGGGGGGSSIVAGTISPFDTYDPYLATRKV
jgi:hypothetical protein